MLRLTRSKLARACTFVRNTSSLSEYCNAASCMLRCNAHAAQLRASAPQLHPASQERRRRACRCAVCLLTPILHWELQGENPQKRGHGSSACSTAPCAAAGIGALVCHPWCAAPLLQSMAARPQALAERSGCSSWAGNRRHEAGRLAPLQLALFCMRQQLHLPEILAAPAATKYVTRGGYMAGASTHRAVRSSYSGDGLLQSSQADPTQGTLEYKGRCFSSGCTFIGLHRNTGLERNARRGWCKSAKS